MAQVFNLCPHRRTYMQTIAYQIYNKFVQKTDAQNTNYSTDIDDADAKGYVNIVLAK